MFVYSSVSNFFIDYKNKGSGRDYVHFCCILACFLTTSLVVKQSLELLVLRTVFRPRVLFYWNLPSVSTWGWMWQLSQLCNVSLTRQLLVKYLKRLRIYVILVNSGRSECRGLLLLFWLELSVFWFLISFDVKLVNNQSYALRVLIVCPKRFYFSSYTENPWCQ